MSWTSMLRHYGTRPEAVKWAKQFPNYGAAWDAAERGSELAWLAGRVSGPPKGAGRKRLVLALCECVRLSAPSDPALGAVEAAEAWARGEGRIGDVRAAYAFSANRRAAATDAAAAATDAYAAAFASAAACASAAFASAAHAHACADAAAQICICAQIYADLDAAAHAYTCGEAAANACAYATDTPVGAKALARAVAKGVAHPLTAYAFFRAAGHRWCADILRRHYPQPPMPQEEEEEEEEESDA